MIKNTLISLILVFTLVSCSDDPYKKYLGLWEQQNVRNDYKVMEITRDGETILMNDNILRFSRGKEPMVLKKSEGQLSIATGFGGAQFGLSENKNTLRVSNYSYKRIDINRLNEIKSNTKSCDILRDEYKTILKKVLMGENINLTESKAEYKSKEKKIPNCRVVIS